LFRLPESTSSGEQSNTPEAMARSFIVPYFGKLPMDPNMMRACEEGKSFLEAYPHSPAARPFAEVVRRLLEATV
jgi:Flp pilus assembly CpaE family ATPase